MNNKTAGLQFIIKFRALWIGLRKPYRKMFVKRKFQTQVRSSNRYKHNQLKKKEKKKRE